MTLYIVRRGRLEGEGLEVAEESDGRGLGEELLVEDATEGKHGEAAVLHLLKLHGLKILLAHACEAHVAGGVSNAHKTQPSVIKCVMSDNVKAYEVHPAHPVVTPFP